MTLPTLIVGGFCGVFGFFVWLIFYFFFFQGALKHAKVLWLKALAMLLGRTFASVFLELFLLGFW